MKLALCQLLPTEDRLANIERARQMLYRAADKGAEMAILPEMFTIPYAAKYFSPAAEPCPGGESFEMLSRVAGETGLFIVGGSIPEKDGNLIYNTNMTFASDGTYLGKYRKSHLFDVDIPGAFSFKESDTITRGNNYPMMVDGPLRMGIMVCFDVRFPEWARIAMDEGADLLAVPAAFSCNTGQRHWELIMRARAVDNQVFMAAVSPAHSEFAYGHSLVITPDGKVLHDCGEDESLAVVELDLDLLQELRNSIPINSARRKDMYVLAKHEN